jgi:hypothetical protein
MEKRAGSLRPGGGGGRGGRLRVAALAGGGAAVRVLGSAPLRAVAVGRRRASSRVRSISVQNEGWGEGRRRRRWSACRGSDDRHGLASRHGLPITESVLRAAVAARPGQQGDSRGSWQNALRKTSRPSRQPATWPANARVCTSRMQCAVTVILLPELRAHG